MRRWIFASLFLFSSAPPTSTYPLDGVASTGIRRLTGYQLVHEGKIKGPFKLPPGSLLRSDQIMLRLKQQSPAFDVATGTPHDPYLQSGLERIFGGRDPSYAVAMLDISDPSKPLYAALRGDDKKIPGSVGKLCVITGLFGALAATWPSIPDRQKVLRETMVDADSFIFTDGKTVPFYHDGDAAVALRSSRRRLGNGEAGRQDGEAGGDEEGDGPGSTSRPENESSGVAVEHV